MKHLLKNATRIDESGQRSRCDILIEDGRIAAVDTAVTETADMTVEDLGGHLVVPGMTDMHVHLREPGQEAKESIESGTQAAAAGGMTRVVTMANTSPVIDSLAALNAVKERAREVGRVKVGVYGAISHNLEGKVLSDMGDMAQGGALGFSDDGHYVESAEFMRRAMEYAATFDKPIIDHAEDMTMAEHGMMHEGRCSAELGLIGRPRVAEDIAVARDLMLAELTGVRMHVAHISSKYAVELVRAAKARGLNVTAEVTAHHLSLTDEELRGYRTECKVAPPLREESDRLALLKGLADGTIDAIVTDHSPHADEEKDVPFCCAPIGMSGLETSLAAVLTYAVAPGHVSLARAMDAMSAAPARILGYAGGGWTVGAPADLTVIDTDAEWTVDPARLYTKSRYTPFAGKHLVGRAVATWVDGRLVMKDGDVK